MPDNRKTIQKILGVTAGVWMISLLVFLFYCRKLDSPGIAAAAYGVWTLFLYGMSYWKIMRVVNGTMEKVDDCIQSLIDGHPVQKFKVEEESLLGKFQVQIFKLYDMMNASRETETRMRRDMSEMVSDLVHQVNTPLTNIQMYCGFLMQDELPPGEREQICKVIDSQVEKLGWFAQGFAKTVRLEEDIMHIEPVFQPILPMVLGAIDQVTPKAGQHGNEILLEGNQDICAVYDRRWTEEALFNLLDNAVKYGQEQSPVTVEMTAYDLFVRIDVKNWGKVIPAGEYNKIFTRFYRGSNAALIKDGVGLGLYLARNIVTEQGGYVKVEKYKNHGNIFSIFLKKQ